ncbi:MAG: phosphatase PAP2 family protein [Thermoleophilaceae bacterium]|nr:phosphatase PAP2 family protein [Thermoleophilaceae bacterium]
MLRAVDIALLRLLRTHGHTPVLEAPLKAYARAGEHGGLWLVLCALGAAADPARRGTWLRALRAVALAYVANQAIKLAVRRPRPQLPGLPPLTSTITRLSYPSAHSATAFACARSLAGRTLPAAPLYAAAAAMALSRPYLGVHYPSDVLAGAALGAAVAELAA